MDRRLKKDIEQLINHVRFNTPEEFLRHFKNEITNINIPCYRGIPCQLDELEERLHSGYEFCYSKSLSMAQSYASQSSDGKGIILMSEGMYGIDVETLWLRLKSEVMELILIDKDVKDLDLIKEFFRAGKGSCELENEVVMDYQGRLIAYEVSDNMYEVEVDPFNYNN